MGTSPRTAGWHSRCRATACSASTPNLPVSNLLRLLQVGWVQSWSAFQPYCKQHGEAAAQQLLERYRHDMAAALRLPDSSTAIPTCWPLHLLLARQPLPLGEAEGQ